MIRADPVAMVAQVDLPLIDGPRLNEILHANPRTESMGILFVGDENSSSRQADCTRSELDSRARRSAWPCSLTKARRPGRWLRIPWVTASTAVSADK